MKQDSVMSHLITLMEVVIACARVYFVGDDLSLGNGSETHAVCLNIKRKAKLPLIFVGGLT